MHGGHHLLRWTQLHHLREVLCRRHLLGNPRWREPHQKLLCHCPHRQQVQGQTEIKSKKLPEVK